jgi:hypothetical protein
LPAGPDDDKEDIYDNLPIKFEPRCKICKSEFRPIIDRLLVSGNSFTMIAEQFRGKDQHLTGSVDAIRKSVERHRRKHLTVRDAAVRDILEERARESGVLVETVRQQLISSEAMLELAVRQGTEQLSQPEAKIKYQDAIRAAELLRDRKYEEMSQQLEVVMRQVQAITQAIQEIVPNEYHLPTVERAKEIFNGPVLPIIPQSQRPQLEVLNGSG